MPTRKAMGMMAHALENITGQVQRQQVPIKDKGVITVHVSTAVCTLPRCIAVKGACRQDCNREMEKKVQASCTVKWSGTKAQCFIIKTKN